MTLVAYHVIIVQQVSCHFPDVSIFIIVVFISLIIYSFQTSFTLVLPFYTDVMTFGGLE